MIFISQRIVSCIYAFRLVTRDVLQITRICTLSLAAAWSVAASAHEPQTGVTSGTCEALLTRSQPGVEIVSADELPAGALIPPGAAAALSGLPAFCRVTATLRPSADSRIGVELWLPDAQHWNGRFLGVGSGGGAGVISYTTGLVEGLRRGFAVATSDLGTAPNANAAVGHPQRWIDFSYRATHEMTVLGKALTDAFYGQPARRAYFEGCSTGGEQALAEAQRYPNDYDGILAGSPGNNRTHLFTEYLWNYQALHRTHRLLFTADELAAVSRAGVAACAGKDGGAPSDTFLTDPRQCRFDPATLPQCDGATQPGGGLPCLSAEQAAALRLIHMGPTDPRTGERIYTPMPVGSEDQKYGIAYQQDEQKVSAQLFFPFRWAFGADYDVSHFDFDRDLDRLDATLAATLNANNPDLHGVQTRHGKILLYTGTADPIAPLQDAINYYERVVALQGSLTATQDFFRLFVVPGMGHCHGGNGGQGGGHFGQPYSPVIQPCVERDALLSLVDWVEQGHAPRQILASAYRDNDPAHGIRMQRPLCAYPEFPDYLGGDPDAASSYRCVAHARGATQVPAARYLSLWSSRLDILVMTEQVVRVIAGLHRSTRTILEVIVGLA